MTEQGKNESRTLSSGEIVHLVKDPGRKWTIRFYESRHSAITGAFTWVEGRPNHWKNREFESAGEAAAFVQKEIEKGKVSGNIRKK